jgi:hypothetical protein
MEETSDEDSEEKREIKTIGTDQIIILKNPSKFDKSIVYEQIPRPWLYNFIIIGLWGR